MKSSIQLANRFREVILDGKWIANTNLKDQLSDITLEEALTRLGNLNTIASLIFHINYYISGVLNVLEGGGLEIHDKYSFDIPAMKSEEDWSELTQRLWTNAERFASQVECMPEEKLDKVFIDEKYGDYRRNIEGMIEHGYYHLGQITLIKKLLRKDIVVKDTR